MDTFRAPERGWAGSGAVLAAGVSLFGLFSMAVSSEVHSPFFAAADLVFPALFTAIIVWMGYRLRGGDLTRSELWTLFREQSVGVVIMFGFAVWYVFLTHLGQHRIPPLVGVVSLVTTGGMFGTLIGLRTVRAQRRTSEVTAARLEREHLESQRETSALLNQLLRHHLLNDLTVILGRADLLDSHLDEAGHPHLEALQTRGREMVETVGTIRDIAQALTEEADPRPVALADSLESVTEAVAATYPEATLLCEVGPVDVTVTGDELLPLVLEHLLHNAIQHNQSDDPNVRISLERKGDVALVHVADDGPGIPDAEKERVFEPSERGQTSEGEGLGLFLSRVVTERYDGTVTVSDNEPQGAVFTVSLPVESVESADSTESVAEPAPETV